MTMVEKVARAIAQSAWEHPTKNYSCKMRVNKSLKQARVAIEAMREPTDNMLAAMDDSQSDRGKWHDAIDAALKE